MNFNPQDCPECMAHYYGKAAVLVEAVASVSLETDGSTSDLLYRYFAVYHRKGHEIEEEDNND